MIEEVIIPFCDFNDWKQLVIYRDFKGDYANEFLDIHDVIIDSDNYPIDTRIDVVTSIGLSIGSGDLVTIEMKTTIF